MDDLLNYYNNLDKASREEFCKQAGVTENYLRKVICKKAFFGAKTCSGIEKATNGEISRRDLRPHDWHLIWPELVQTA